MQWYNNEVAKHPALRDCAVAFVPSSKIDRPVNEPVILLRDFLSPGSPKVQKLDSPRGETRSSFKVEDELFRLEECAGAFQSGDVEGSLSVYGTCMYSSVFLLPYNFPIHADCRTIKREPADGISRTCRLASAGSAGIMECSQRRPRVCAKPSIWNIRRALGDTHGNNERKARERKACDCGCR